MKVAVFANSFEFNIDLTWAVGDSGRDLNGIFDVYFFKSSHGRIGWFGGPDWACGLPVVDPHSNPS